MNACPATLLAASLLSALSSQTIPSPKALANAARTSALSLGGKAVVAPVFAIANSSDLLVEENQHRILQVILSGWTLRQSAYPRIPSSAKPIDGCLMQDKTVAILDDSEPKRIIELSPGGAIRVLALSNAIDSVFSIAPWKD